MPEPWAASVPSPIKSCVSWPENDQLERGDSSVDRIERALRGAHYLSCSLLFASAVSSPLVRRELNAFVRELKGYSPAKSKHAREQRNSVRAK